VRGGETHPDPFDVRGRQVVGVVAHPFGSGAVDGEDLQAVGITVDESQDRNLKLVTNLTREEGGQEGREGGGGG
jgi:hypothetical protein